MATDPFMFSKQVGFAPPLLSDASRRPLAETTDGQVGLWPCVFFDSRQDFEGAYNQLLELLPESFRTSMQQRIQQDLAELDPPQEATVEDDQTQQDATKPSADEGEPNSDATAPTSKVKRLLFLLGDTLPSESTTRLQWTEWEFVSFEDGRSSARKSHVRLHGYQNAVKNHALCLVYGPEFHENRLRYRTLPDYNDFNGDEILVPSLLFDDMHVLLQGFKERGGYFLGSQLEILTRMSEMSSDAEPPFVYSFYIPQHLPIKNLICLRDETYLCSFPENLHKALSSTATHTDGSNLRLANMKAIHCVNVDIHDVSIDTPGDVAAITAPDDHSLRADLNQKDCPRCARSYPQNKSIAHDVTCHLARNNRYIPPSPAQIQNLSEAEYNSLSPAMKSLMNSSGLDQYLTIPISEGNKRQCR